MAQVELRKWDYNSGTYKPYLIPADWKVTIYEKDMDKPCNCAGCGANDKYGNMYSSAEIQNNLGLGYMVCKKCNNQEWERRLKFMRGQK